MKHRLCGIVMCAVVLVFWNGASNGVVNEYVEDFTTTLYKDAVNTTAWWDDVTGELKLYPFAMTLAGSYDTPGMGDGVYISGDHAFLADGNSGLQVIDISNPSAPTLAGTYNTPGDACGVFVSGDHAFVTDAGSGLQVIDISNPAAPTLAGAYDTPSTAEVVYVSGNYAFVADRTSLQVINVTFPTAPYLAGSYVTPGTAYGVHVAGDYAYVADAYDGLTVLDITNPAAPTLAGTYDTPGFARDVVASGDLAFVAVNDDGLQIIDISDPTAPTFVGAYDTPERANVVYVSGDRAFIAGGWGGLQVIDVRNPAAPALVGTYLTPGYASGVHVSGDRAYVGNVAAGLVVIDVADRTEPTPAGTHDTPGDARGVCTAGDYTLVADGTSGLQVIDITDPRVPTLAGTYDTPDNAFGVCVSGDHAFVADYSSGLQVIDITNPGVPTLAGTYNTPGDARGVCVSGNYAFVADGSTGLQVINIVNPSAPTLAGSYITPFYSYGIDVSGDHAFVADGETGLLVINILNPAVPQLAGTRDTPGVAFAVDVSGDYAYVADGGFGLQVINILNPSLPTLIGSYDTPGGAYGVCVSGDYAFLADHTSGLHVIDISDPSAPELLDTYDTPGGAQDVYVDGDFAYAADYGSGLQVIQVFQSEVKTGDNVGRSLAVDGSNDTIFAARLTTTQTDSVAWELSADGGTSWQEIEPDGSWNQMVTQGIDLVWRSTHTWVTPGTNPTVTQLEIDWLNQFAAIESIVDVPNDQGRQVSLRWARSGYDFVGSPTPIEEYAVFRRIDTDLSMSAAPGRDGTDSRVFEVTQPGLAGQPRNRPEAELAYPPGDWHFVTTVPADAEYEYAVVVPTLADSTIVEGMYYSTFFVRARTGTPGVYFDSHPDSGYSVDNLEPSAPQGFAVAYNTGSGNQLAWEECPDEDFDYFRVYRSESEGFQPAPGDLVYATTGTEWLDTTADGWKYYYKVTAVDFSGNESDPSSAGTMTAITDPVVPKRFALYPNIPNPFNPVTTIRYDVPEGGGDVTLRVYSVDGRLVRTLVDGAESPGEKSVTWDGRDDSGHVVASGVYFYRLTSKDYTMTRKMLLMK